MPHFHIDYSPNLEVRMDIMGFCTMLRDAAMETGMFPLAGLRIRATPVKFVVMADGNSDHAFLDLSIRLRAGREMDAKRAAVQHMFEATERYCADILESSSFMLSFEMRDIDPELSPKVSSIRRYLSGETP